MNFCSLLSLEKKRRWNINVGIIQPSEIPFDNSKEEEEDGDGDDRGCGGGGVVVMVLVLIVVVVEEE
ncbi:hypothetical protein M0802_013186 [Mischocyttarus mexicanus]|nr:hypothetical protein M0802_013201 [Mischocyttarus mexicanus]KAI4483934.1 hypothetical protein M0802_013186 [Mischocyttarus mexicanus]